MKIDLSGLRDQYKSEREERESRPISKGSQIMYLGVVGIAIFFGLVAFILR